MYIHCTCTIVAFTSPTVACIENTLQVVTITALPYHKGVPEMSSEAHSSGAVTLSTGGGEQPSSTSSEVSEERGKDNQSLRVCPCSI